MSDIEYTPTTEVVRDEWVHLEGFIIPDGVPKREAAFDRWLAEHDREVAAKALGEAAREFSSAAAAGVEPVLNLLAAKLLLDRARRLFGLIESEPIASEPIRAALGVPEEAERG